MQKKVPRKALFWLAVIVNVKVKVKVIVNVLNIPVDFFHLAGEPERSNGLLAVF